MPAEGIARDGGAGTVRRAAAWAAALLGVVTTFSGMGSTAIADEQARPIEPAAGPASAEDAFVARRRARLAHLPPAPAVPDVGRNGMHPVDRFLAASWREAGLAEAEHPPGLCDDSTFVRRAYLDLLGVIPTVEERDRFVGDPRPIEEKRAALIDELLARHEDYADHWTAFWEDALVSSPVGINAGMATHGNYTAWIRRAFVENRAYDLFAAELIDPTLPGHKPAEMGSDNGAPRRVHYILNQSHTDTLQSAAGVAQVFMGTAMKCAGCHNHFENDEWPQRRFLAFAGLFSGEPLELIRCEKRSGEVVPARFPFELPGIAAEPPAGERERLHHAAVMLVDPANPRFAWTIVNRLWKRSFGLGLIEPADDYREEIGASQPELLAWLADDFVRNGYDLKRTLRLIMTSRAYQSRYDPGLEDEFDTQDPGAPRFFRSPTLRRLSAEQLIDSIGVATGQTLDRRKRLYRRSDSTNLSRALGKPAIRNDVTTERSDQIAVLQGLEMLNGQEFEALTRGGMLAREASAAESAGAAAGLVFRAALSRGPTEREVALVADLFKERAGEKEAAVQDLLWAVFASPEFQYIR